MHDAVIMQVCDGRERGSNEVRGVRLEVIAFSADTIKKLAAQGEVGHQVYCEVAACQRTTQL